MNNALRAAEILMVEDSPSDRLIAIEALNQAKLINNLNTVENGVEAMAYLRREGPYSAAPRPDLILLDLNLPKKDGREVLRELKNDPVLKFIPVVILTTSDAEEDVVSSYGNYANSFIRKPVDFARFAEVIRSAGGYWFEIVTLPTEDAIRRAARSDLQRPPVRMAEPSQAVRVLLVEDDPASVLIVRHLLQDSAVSTFQVEAVSRVRDLRARADLASFDIVLTDLGLPDSQGLETYRQVRSCVAGRPIIVLTGLDDEETGLRALRAGAQDYLVKAELTGRMLARAVRYAVDKKRIEDQLRQSQRLEAIGQLAAGVAHDFNNLLTVIQGEAEFLLTSSELSQDAPTSLAAIVEASERAANLTRQLLTFSRPRSMQPRGLEVNAVVGAVGGLLRRVLGAPISLELQLTAEPAIVDADMGMLEQVLMNLAVNAKDAMPGGGKLTLSTAVVTVDRDAAAGPDAYPGRFVKLTVADSGAGIAPEVLPHIFEPFFTTKDLGQGTGLGLATVYNIVQQHRGWLSVFTQPGMGTRFEIFLPASSLPTAPVEPVAPKTVGGQETILIVEDEAAVLRLAAHVLARAGYRILSAASGAEVLANWERYGHEVDLLVTDLMMPGGVSGQQLAVALRERTPHLEILFTSGYSPDIDQLRQGTDFLPKPYTPSALMAAARARLDAVSRRGLEVGRTGNPKRSGSGVLR